MAQEDSSLDKLCAEKKYYGILFLTIRPFIYKKAFPSFRLRRSEQQLNYA